MIKSEREIEYMTESARLIEKTMQAGLDAIEPGVRQCDAAAAIDHAHYSGTAEYGGEYTSFVPMLPTAGSAPRRHT